MGDHASANGFEGQLATWIHWWSSVASRSDWPLRSGVACLLLVGLPLNADSTQSATLPSIADVGGVPYVAWDPDI